MPFTISELKNWKFWIILAILVLIFLMMIGPKEGYDLIGVPDKETLVEHGILKRVPVNEREEHEEHEVSSKEYIENLIEDVLKEKYENSQIINTTFNPVGKDEINLLLNNREKINTEPLNFDDTPEVPQKFKEKERKNKFKYKVKNKFEKVCKEALEEAYPGYIFDTQRPDWLENPETGYNLELDVYNEVLRIAVEYNGPQHYKYPNPFHNSIEEFVEQLRRDEYKQKMCDLHDVYLIRIPYTVDFNKIRDHIFYYLPENYEKRLRDEKLIESLKE